MNGKRPPGMHAVQCDWPHLLQLLIAHTQRALRLDVACVGRSGVGAERKRPRPFREARARPGLAAARPCSTPPHTLLPPRAYRASWAAAGAGR